MKTAQEEMGSMMKLTRWSVVLALTTSLLPVAAFGQSKAVVMAQRAEPTVTPALERLARLEIQNVPLADALVQLYESSRVPISFSPSLLPEDARVSCDCDALTVGAALDRVLDGTGLRYREIAGHVLIHAKQPRTDTERRIERSAPRYATSKPRVVLAALQRVFVSSEKVKQGVIAGIVTDAETGQPVQGAQVVVEGTGLGTATNAQGRFRFDDVEGEEVTLRVVMIGYVTVTRTVTVGTTDVGIPLRVQALRLDEIVATGVVDPTAGVRAPFSVGVLSSREMPVPTTHSALAALQGKIAGVNIIRNNGQPGTGVSIQLRTPTSIIRSNSPLYVVDGVILARPGGNTVDLESLDIEKIEVIKGAAAAALYGSRAASGVVSITTARGSGVPLNTSRITVRSEIGVSELPQGIDLAKAHYYETNDAGEFLNADGNVAADRTERVVAADRIMDHPYIGRTYDNVSRFYRPGLFLTNSASLAHNSAETNLRLSFNRYRERGTVPTNDGFERNNVRLNVDHRLSDRLSLGASFYHNRGDRDNISGSPFWDLLMFDPDVDIDQKNPDGSYVAKPDPLVDRENPLWRQTTRDNYHDRTRSLTSGTIRFEPVSWFRLDADLSYDRADRMYQIYVPLGVEVPSSSDADEATDGRLQRIHYIDTAINASLSAHLRWQLGDLNGRTMLRGLMERDTYDRTTANAEEFWVRDVPRFDVARIQETTGFSSDIRSNGLMAQTGLEYRDRYIADLLVRRDGSSLFGPEERWHTYYRASFAYRMAQESWWPFPWITEFKPRYSVGTAGGRPNFSDQYETWGVTSAGEVSKSTLGNRFLSPEHTIDREVGLDAIIANRYQVELTYARHTSKGQIIQIPQPAISGYSNRYENSGTIEGSTFEVTLQALLHRGRNTSWTSTLVADKSKSDITEWNRVCYIASDTWSLVQRCEGLTRSNMHGNRFYTSLDQLPAWLAEHSDHFDVNDDGYIVAVGPGGSWSDGNWGDEVTVGDRTYEWGMPVIETDEAGNRVLEQIGDSQPDLSLGWINQFTWGGLTFHTHLHGQFGGDVYNYTKQRLYQWHRHGDVDQTGKPEEAKKPIDYYSALYLTNDRSNHFIEDGTYVKLRELAVRYAFNSGQLDRVGLGNLGIEQLTLGLIGRNLLTWTDYSGFDPEVGSVSLRVDDFDWPQTRTLTANIEIQF